MLSCNNSSMPHHKECVPPDSGITYSAGRQQAYPRPCSQAVAEQRNTAQHINANHNTSAGSYTLHLANCRCRPVKHTQNPEINTMPRSNSSRGHRHVVHAVYMCFTNVWLNACAASHMTNSLWQCMLSHPYLVNMTPGRWYDACRLQRPIKRQRKPAAGGAAQRHARHAA